VNPKFAVIGTSLATQRIVTGDRLGIDGSAGLVEILRDESTDSAAWRCAPIGL
jgi:hypothetical protein